MSLNGAAGHRSPFPSPAQPSPGLAGRRPRPSLRISDIPGAPRLTPSGGGAMGAGLGAGRPDLSNGIGKNKLVGENGSPFENFRKIVDPSGALNFKGKAVLHAKGVDFTNGASFNINMSEFSLDEELGRGNYGTVRKVWHKPTKVAMAMKEIRLELDDSKLAGIIMELDILHRACAPEIVDFYGAFFIETCVYYCMEYMDAGSLDSLVGYGMPEDVLARITGAMVRGLRFLKDELQIIHRDVKPTNVLISKKGVVKLCDFGVSGQLERSLAKTNIGCQSYMAPERIKGESQNNLGTYTVASDVWSLGLSIVELAMGKYPYPPETYANVFAQLTAIVHGPPPELPDEYSEDAMDFTRQCLRKEPEMRYTYSQLLDHPFLVSDRERDVDMVSWVSGAMEHRAAVRAAAANGGAAAPASAAGPDSSSSAPASAPAPESAPPPE
ncbi:hypothetical protein BOTBODRAFT_214628 [Botryobasidium botryosum FD-172 SS1]|uniref:mitogen-activated protein kinase kinase n=1 Tax=Botryobasidium botryosum (strain FD-172 SS1) TaxID=930990 RepID=A0A067N1I9_BOTB1|nr:hypothetical protein BOTBODRAFT_214628 [Botryobasidium botryosum FD-172 SS1]